jgi:hypothetical protein
MRRRALTKRLIIFSLKNHSPEQKRKKAMRFPAGLSTVVWHNENHVLSAFDTDTGASTTPPPLKPDQWHITRFEVMEDGAILHLWWAAIPAKQAIREESQDFSLPRRKNTSYNEVDR